MAWLTCTACLPAWLLVCSEEKWVEVARSNACYNAVEPRYYGNPHQEVPFGMRDLPLKITL